MDKQSYPQPVCERCGMPMTLRLDAQKWYCETCKEFTKPQEPPRIVPPPSDPAKPKGRWIKFAIVAAIVFILTFIRVFII